MPPFHSRSLIPAQSTQLEEARAELVALIAKSKREFDAEADALKAAIADLRVDMENRAAGKSSIGSTTLSSSKPHSSLPTYFVVERHSSGPPGAGHWFVHRGCLIVNICIQIATGVIFAFIAEHIIILCCLFALLAILGYNTFDFNAEKDTLSKKNARPFTYMDEVHRSFMRRLKKWYITSFRSLVFCNDVSDYGWSVKIIVLTQCVAIIFGTLTISFQWLIVIRNLDMNRVVAIADELQDLKLHFFFMIRRSTRALIRVLSRISLKLAVLAFLLFIHAPILAIPFIVYKISGGRVGEFRWCMHKARDQDIVFAGFSLREFDLETLNKLSRRMVMFCIKTMNKWANVIRDSLSSHMVQILSRRPDLSTSSLPNLSTSTHLNDLLRVGDNYSPRPYKVTCLTMVLLVKLGIDSRKQRLAKFIWEGGDIDMSKEIPSKYLNDPVKYAVSNVERAFCVLPHKELLEDDLRAIRSFIRLRQYATIEEFCECIEQLFSEMLHFFLTQLPNCVSKVAKEVSVEDCEAQARSTTKLLCEVLDSRLEDKVGWIFPKDCFGADHFFQSIGLTNM
ncbi:hypothetical protein Sjap_009422 [Stephania japonica]|uniref:Uncharacterized protein n=1 Tax=Stephania japonica TaxID=461633 RepID=A0AAP0JSV8_9MAGN